MTLTIQPVRSPAALRDFIFLPEKLPNGRPNWIPPIWMDEHVFHSNTKNPAHSVCRVERWLAIEAGRIIGRIMGIIHDEYNATHGEKTARFFGLECINRQDVVHKLLAAAEKWAIDQGMEKLIGPFGFSDKDPEGLQVDGFENLPVIATATNASYLPTLVEKENYTKLTDCVVYQISVPKKTPVIYERIAKRIHQQLNVRVINFTRRKELKPFVIPVFELINATYKDLLGFVPLSMAEMKKLKSQYLSILQPKFIKVVVDLNNRVIGFVIAVPDFSLGLQRSNGRMFPFGFLKVLHSMKRTKQLDILLGAVHPDYQGRGLTTLLGMELLRDVREAGFEYMDSHLILETNFKMRGEMERIGGKVYKRYRIYQKPLR